MASKRKAAIEIDVVANVAKMQGNFQDATTSLKKFHGDFKRVAADQQKTGDMFKTAFRFEAIMKTDGIMRSFREVLPEIKNYVAAWQTGQKTIGQAISDTGDKLIGLIPVMRESYAITQELLRGLGGDYDPDKSVREAQQRGIEDAKERAKNARKWARNQREIKEQAEAVAPFNAMAEHAKSPMQKIMDEAEKRTKLLADGVEKSMFAQREIKAIKGDIGNDFLQSVRSLQDAGATPLDNALAKIDVLKEGLAKGFVQLPEALAAQADILSGVIKEGVDAAKAVKLEAENTYKKYDWEKRDHYTTPKVDESVSVLNKLLGASKTTEQIMRDQLQEMKDTGGESIRIRLVGG